MLESLLLILQKKCINKCFLTDYLPRCDDARSWIVLLNSNTSSVFAAYFVYLRKYIINIKLVTNDFWEKCSMPVQLSGEENAWRIISITITNSNFFFCTTIIQLELLCRDLQLLFCNLFRYLRYRYKMSVVQKLRIFLFRHKKLI